jgi:hypothetical protein
LASVTCASGLGGNPSIKGLIASVLTIADPIAQPCREWLYGTRVMLPRRTIFAMWPNPRIPYQMSSDRPRLAPLNGKPLMVNPVVAIEY